MGNQRSVLSDVQLDDRAGLVNTAGSDSTTHDPEPAGAMPMRKRGTLDEMSDEERPIGLLRLRFRNAAAEHRFRRWQTASRKQMRLVTCVIMTFGTA